MKNRLNKATPEALPEPQSTPRRYRFERTVGLLVLLIGYVIGGNFLFNEARSIPMMCLSLMLICFGALALWQPRLLN